MNARRILGTAARLSFALTSACGSVGHASSGDSGDSGGAHPAEAGVLDASRPTPDATATPDTGFATADTGSATRPDASDAAVHEAASDVISTLDSMPLRDAPVPEGDAGKTKYDSDGPIAFTTSSLSVTGATDSFTENLYVPTPPGTYPVVSFSPGTQQPSTAYTSYASRLASWGFIVVIRDDPGALAETSVVVDDLTQVITTWLPAQNTTSGSALFGKVDLTRVGLAGHSRGGQATLLALEGGLAGKVVAWFGVDPTDIGVLAGPQAGPTLSTIGIPTTFLGGGVTTACSPATANYEVLYGDAPSPSVAVTAINASHTQFEDPASCTLCGLCTPMGTADSAVVLAYSVKYFTAFFARELQGDTAVGPTFQGAGGPADVAAGLVQITSK